MFTVQNYKIYKNQKKIVRVLFAAAPFFVILIDWLLEGRIRSIFIGAIGFSIMAVISVLFWIYSPKLYDIITQRNAERILFKEGKLNILGKRELLFEEEHIRYITEYEEGVTKYTMITDIQESDTAIYFYISPATAIIIPLRVFDSEDIKRELIRFINTKVK